MEVSKWRRPGEEELTRNWRFLYNEHKIISYIKVREIDVWDMWPLENVTMSKLYSIGGSSVGEEKEDLGKDDELDGERVATAKKHSRSFLNIILI